MDINTWLVFFTSYLLITLSPGPNVILVLQNVLKYGYQSGMISIFANLCCQLAVVCLVAFGAGTIIEKFPFLFLMLKILGGCYLIFLGLTSVLKKKSKPTEYVETLKENSCRVSFFTLFKSGCLVSMSNPKTLLFLSAFLPQFLNHSDPVIPQFAIMFLSMAVCVLTVHLVYSYFAVSVKHKMTELSFKPSSLQNVKKWLNRVTGGAYILLGGGILVSQK